MRGILISPVTREISVVEIPKGLEGLKLALSADPAFSGMVELVRIGRTTDLWIDEEGNLSEGRPVFKMGKNYFSGVCLLLGNNQEGDSCLTEANLHLVSEIVTWTDLETTGDFGPSSEYVTDHAILGPDTRVLEGGKPIYRKRENIPS